MTRKQIEKEAQRRTNKFKVPDNNLIAYEKGFVEGAEWALSHQWVSVEDELPPFEENVLVKIKLENLITNEIRHRTNNPKVYVDKNKFAIYDYEVVTHWMPIPLLAEKGGEK